MGSDRNLHSRRDPTPTWSTVRSARNGRCAGSWSPTVRWNRHSSPARASSASAGTARESASCAASSIPDRPGFWLVKRVESVDDDTMRVTSDNTDVADGRLADSSGRSRSPGRTASSSASRDAGCDPAPARRLYCRRHGRLPLSRTARSVRARRHGGRRPTGCRRTVAIGVPPGWRRPGQRHRHDRVGVGIVRRHPHRGRRRHLVARARPIRPPRSAATCR